MKCRRSRKALFQVLLSLKSHHKDIFYTPL
nr:MAG TPA: hypothetical protein [Caudoviricetes sp.]